MNRIALDIETAPLDNAAEMFDDSDVKVGNLKDPEKVKAKIEAARAEFVNKAALSPYTGQVTCICLHNDEVSIPLYIGNGEGMEDEADLLSNFWVMWRQYEQIITYNGYSFDMQYIIIRSMVHGIPAPYLRARGYRYIRDIDRDRHIDLINLFDSGGNWVGLNKAAKAILRLEKDGDGLKAIELFKEGRHKELAEYCRVDAALTWELWKVIGGE